MRKESRWSGLLRHVLHRPALIPGDRSLMPAPIPRIELDPSQIVGLSKLSVQSDEPHRSALLD